MTYRDLTEEEDQALELLDRGLAAFSKLYTMVQHSTPGPELYLQFGRALQDLRIGVMKTGMLMRGVDAGEFHEFGMDCTDYAEAARWEKSEARKEVRSRRRPTLAAGGDQ